MTQFTLSAFADEASPEFDRQIAALHRKHIPLMEIRGVDGKGILDLTDEELDVVEKKLAAGKIGISAIGSPIGKVDVAADAEAHLLRFESPILISWRAWCVSHACRAQAVLQQKNQKKGGGDEDDAFFEFTEVRPGRRLWDGPEGWC